jgi:hypothetical protein
MKVSDQLQALAALPPCNPLDGRLHGPQSRSGRDGEEKSHFLIRAENRTSVVQSVAKLPLLQQN